MKHGHISGVLLLLTGMSSCSVSDQEVVGTYTIHGLKNRLDTLTILPNGTYRRTLHQQAGNQLLYKGTDAWRYADGSIALNNFLITEDDDSALPALRGGEIFCLLPVEKRLSQIVIYYQADGSNTRHYQKLD